MGRHALKAVLAALLLAFPALAQDRKKPQEEILRTDIQGDNGLIREDGDAKTVLFTGDVRLKRGDQELTAARIMAWYRGEAVEEVYAEGNVTFRQGDRKLRADRLYFNLAKDRAIILDLRARGTRKDVEQGFNVTASEARMTLGRLEMDDVRMSTCSYGVPHFHFGIGSAALIGTKPRPKREGFPDPWNFDGWEFELKHVTPELAGVPLFFLPSLTLGDWVKEFPLRSLGGGRSTRFGPYVYSDWGVRLKRDVEGHDPRTWAEIQWELDWREQRGGAYGLDFIYEWEGYQGFLDTYYLHDLGRNTDVAFEAKFAPLEREERGRARFFHRHDVAPDWRYEIEASYVSDRDLIEEFFEKEFKEGKEQETAAYVRWIDGSRGGYLLERHRLNDFQTQNEYLPKLDFILLQEPLAESPVGDLLVTERFDAGRIRRRTDEDLHVESFSSWRLDSLTELALPVDLEVLQVSPFGQYRLTAYEHDLELEKEARSMWTAGARAVTQVHGTWPGVTWDWTGLRGLRGVSEFEARYARVLHSDVHAAELYPFEEVDQLDEFDEVAFEWRWRLLTRGADARPYEFMDGWVGVEVYPDPLRDTTGPRVTNNQYPFNWITLAPDPDTGVYEDRHGSNLHYGLSLHPRNLLKVSAGGEYNPETRHEEVRELLLSVQPAEGVSASTMHTFVRGITDAYTFQVALNVTEKWAVSSEVQYDFRTDEWLSQDLVVSSDYHDFLIQGVLEHDFGRDERRVFVTFVPKFLGKSGLRKSRLAPAGREQP